MKTYITKRGFKRADFKDIYGFSCSIQESSLVEKKTIWLGQNENRMLLDKKLSWKLANRLLWFSIFGKF